MQVSVQKETDWKDESERTSLFDTNFKEFDPGSGRTLAARLTHASRTVKESLLSGSVADG